MTNSRVSGSNVLVVGGAGYIGSHMAKALSQDDWGVVTLDDFSTGYREAVRYGECIEGDLGDAALLDRVLSNYAIGAVMHFAAYSLVGESVVAPARYYRNNVAKTQVLLDALVRNGVSRFIFSSTAAVYGEPVRVPIDEDHPQQPVNPYGASKWMVERMLADYGAAYGLRSVSLRYFNAAGADPDGDLGERHDPETHLIPNVLRAASGRQEAITINGRDYSTQDGTCVRDYIHVSDLCAAHSKALDHLYKGGEGGAFNLGNGDGYSVQQVVDTARSVTGREIPVREGSRRAGDPARLVADARRANLVLGWEPLYGLDEIVQHAWNWELRMAEM